MDRSVSKEFVSKVINKHLVDFLVNMLANLIRNTIIAKKDVFQLKLNQNLNLKGNLGHGWGKLMKGISYFEYNDFIVK